MPDQEEDKKKPISFLQTFFEDRKTPSIYSKVFESVTGKTIFKRDAQEAVVNDKKLYSFTDVPGYLDFEAKAKNKSFKIKKSSLFDGFLIDLTKYNSIDDYLKDNFGKSGRSKLRRYQKRLDLCIKPTYKMYYGDIDEDEYNKLFDCLRELMMRRFFEKKEENIELPVLDEYRALMRPLILKKQASLFVIYHDEKPIDICMNIIYDNIVSSYNSSYDVDYNAFSLGTLDVLKHVEWCFENGFEIFDLGRGDYLYKRRWTNFKYPYERHMIYDVSSPYHKLISILKMGYTQFKYDMVQVLKKFGVQHLYGKYYQLHYIFFRKNLHVEEQKKYDIINDFETPDATQLNEVCTKDREYTWLLKPINDFIYKAHEKFADIIVKKDLNESNTFYLMGKKAVQKIKG